ncbi:zinc knuckle CX2CX4HX4C containing protein [Tanacetum coccineum]
MAFTVVEYYVRNNWAKHGLTRIMMNNKGFFLFKFNLRASLEAVLEGGPWLIHKSPIILMNWSIDTRLLKKELTRIPIWVKLHDVHIQFAGYSVKQNVRYEPKATTSTPKKRATNVGNSFKPSSTLKTTSTSSKNDNIITSNSYSALVDEEEDEEEDVENVYDEYANLFQNTKASRSLSFTAAVG